jgi:hypothetical protein
MAQAIQTVAVQYNQIPANSSLKKNFKPLGRDEKATYRLIGSTDPSKPGKFFGPSKFVPATDVVTDEKGNTYDIAYIDKVGRGGVPEFGEIFFNEDDRFRMTLYGKSAKDVRLYEYLEMSNYLKRESESNIQAIIERVTQGMDEKRLRARKQKIRDAVDAAQAFSNEEVLNFIRANRLADPGEEEARRWVVESYAENNPEAFANAPMADYTSLYDIVDKAKQQKIVTFNNSTRAVLKYDGSELFEVKKGSGVSWKEELAKFLIDPKNKEQLNWIKAEIEK